MTALIRFNPIMQGDAYKYSHKWQVPSTTGFVSSYVESRGGRWNSTVFAGLQVLLMDWEANPIEHWMIDEAKAYITEAGLPFNEDDWRIIVDEFDGKMPIKIQALPEGLNTPTKTVLVQIVNTDRRFPWLTSFIETAILRATWYMTTVATISRAVKKVIKANLLETADNLDSLPFKLHDFAARGVSSSESAALGGVAHLINFMGTDTVESFPVADIYYGTRNAGFSIPASEHSTASAWGPDNEEGYARHMLTTFPLAPLPEGVPILIGVVSDTYDIFNMVRNIWCGSMRDEVRASGKTIVIRPDSGDPVTVIREIFKIMGECLDDVYINTKGYKMLPDYYRVLQGDGVNPDSIQDILDMLKEEGWSGENIVFGMGGKLMQAEIDRDTQRFAMKASAAQYGNMPWVDIYKSPITDAGKKSKRGRFAVIYDGEDQIITVPMAQASQFNLLKEVFLDGMVTLKYTLTEMRELADRGW